MKLTTVLKLDRAFELLAGQKDMDQATQEALLDARIALLHELPDRHDRHPKNTLPPSKRVARTKKQTNENIKTNLDSQG